MRLNDKGEWVETGDVKFDDNPPQRTFEMTLRKQNEANIQVDPGSHVVG